ncbi:MAG: head GIN domain-containing protein [Lutibacter sp.]
MKKVVVLILSIVLISCNSENAGNCFQTAGTKIQKEFQVPTFTKITVHDKIELYITEGTTQKVIVETGKNLMPDIKLEVIDNRLVLTNDNTCNFFRDYNETKVYITSPNLTEIRNASTLSVNSIGTLTYPNIYLKSVGEKRKFLATGDFNLSIENNEVTIWSNGIANLNLTGTTKNLKINFSNGDTRFNGQNFIAKNIDITQVSSNDMLVFPTEKLSGTIRSTGDVIVFNKPPEVTLQALSVGQIIYN